jgi:acyl dehydratase
MNEAPQAFYLEDLTLGENIACGTFRLTEREIMTFAAQYDPQPFHLSLEAARESAFGGLVASSTQSLAVSCGLVVRALANVKIMGGAAWEDIKLHRPVWPDRDYDVRARWFKIRPSASKPDRGIANLAIEVLEGDTVVMSYGVAYFVRRRPAPSGA